MAKIFRKGKQIESFDELLEARTNGSGWVFLNDKPLQMSFVGCMQFESVRVAVAEGRFYKAIRKGQTPATSGYIGELLQEVSSE